MNHETTPPYLRDQFTTCDHIPLSRIQAIIAQKHQNFGNKVCDIYSENWATLKSLAAGKKQFVAVWCSEVRQHCLCTFMKKIDKWIVCFQLTCFKVLKDCICSSNHTDLCKITHCSLFVSPKLRKDYVITHAVHSDLNRHGVKGHLGVNDLWFKFLEKGSLYPHSLMYFHGTWTQWPLGRVTHVTSTDFGSKVI